MATVKTTSAVGEADPKAAELPPQSTGPITNLCIMLEPMTVNEQFTQAARYAQDPRSYLLSSLGQKAFDAKLPLLSLCPTGVDEDRYGTGSHKQHFERHIARLLGKEHGLFFITGIQAQLTALRIYCDRQSTPSCPNRRVAWHATSHLETAELDAYADLFSLERVLVGSDPARLPTVDEIQAVLALPPARRPCVLLVELPNRSLGCRTYGFAELEAISHACRAAGVAFHCDGARLWEIEPWYTAERGQDGDDDDDDDDDKQRGKGEEGEKERGANRAVAKTLADLGALFDSVYVSMYKGLRGAPGSVLVCPDEAFWTAARGWQRKSGGNLFTSHYNVVEGERGFNENLGSFRAKWEKMRAVADGVRARTAGFRVPAGREGEGERVLDFSPERPTCCQAQTVLKGFTMAEWDAARDRVQERTRVRVFERLSLQKSPEEQGEAFRAMYGQPSSKKGSAAEPVAGAGFGQGTAPESMTFSIEWMIMNVNLKIDTDVFVDAYVALCEELLQPSGS